MFNLIISISTPLTLLALISDEEKKSNYIFIFTLFCSATKEGLYGLDKTFFRTTKKCENKNLQYNFQKCTGR